MVHIWSWRRSFRDSLRQLRDGRTVAPPPDDIEAFNAEELAKGAGVPLAEAAERSEGTLTEIIDLWNEVGARPMSWYVANTTGDAAIRNSYHHPRIHIAEHYQQRGDRATYTRMLEESADDLRRAQSIPHTLGAALYNLSLARVAGGRHDEAIALLEEALPMRPDIRAAASEDADLAPLRSDPRFQAMLGEPSKR